MTTLPVRSFVNPDHPAMKKKLEPIENKKLGSKWFRRKMEETVGTLQEAIYTPGSGAVAIAANQLGIECRFFVMLTMLTMDDGLTDEKRERRRKAGIEIPDQKRQLGIVVLINPEVINVRGVMEEDWEGCLSYPGKQFLIERFPKIKVRYVNAKGQTVEEELEGLDARIFMHEMDHLDGIRPPDKATKERETPLSTFSKEQLAEVVQIENTSEPTPE